MAARRTRWLLLAATGVSAGVLVGATARQAWLGLGSTGMDNAAPWGANTANLHFWAGLASAALLLSAALHLSRADWPPATRRLAEVVGGVAALTALWFVAPDLGRPWLGGAAALGLGTEAGALSARSPWVWDLAGAALPLAVGAILLYGPKEGRSRQWLIRAAIPLLVCGNSVMACGLAIPAGVAWHAAVLAPASLVTGARIAVALVLLLGVSASGKCGHQAALATWIAVTGAATALGYAAELCLLAAGGPSRQAALGALAMSEPAPVVYALPLCNCAAPLLLVWPRLRGVRACVGGVCAASVIGGWLEAVVAVGSAGGALPAAWAPYRPGVVEWACTLAAALFFGSLVLVAARTRETAEGRGGTAEAAA